jgi:glutathione S-transferase
LRALNDEVLPRHLQFLENFASASTTGWIAGTEGPSIADFVLGTRLIWLFTGGFGFSLDLLVPCPHLRAMIDRFNALPEIVAYYTQRRAA